MDKMVRMYTVGLGGAKDKETMYSVLQLSSSPMIGNISKYRGVRMCLT